MMVPHQKKRGATKGKITGYLGAIRIAGAIRTWFYLTGKVNYLSMVKIATIVFFHPHA